MKKYLLRIHNSGSVSDCAVRYAAGGFTFVELLVIVAVSAVAATGIIMGLHEAVKTLAFQNDLRSATILAEDLMYEIRSKRFSGAPTPGPTRVNFDDVSDYDGWTRSPPETIEGVAMTNYSGFTTAITVTNVLADLATPVSTNTGFKLVRVVVSSDNVAISNLSVVTEYDDW